MDKFYYRLLMIGTFLIVSLSASAQQVLQGVVTDDTKMTLPGVNIVVDSSGLGTTTDIDGKYSIELTPGKHTITFRYIGFADQSKEIEIVAGQPVPPLDIVMTTDDELLEEVVVVGYGVQRKREVSGSIVSVDSKTINEIPTGSFESALQGQAAGVQVTTSSGVAGSGSVVRVRGIASISASGDPLYVVDGIPVNQDQFVNGNSGGSNANPLATIPPGDIESVEILKDASATGIYGSRGANGVIIITTKRAKKNGLVFDFSTRVGAANPTAKPNMLNSEEYLQLYQEAYENDGGTGYAPLQKGITWEDARNTNTNWVDETIQTGFKQNYTFSVKQKTDKYGLMASASYDGNESYLSGNSYNRTSMRLNLDFNAAKKVQVGLNVSAVNGVNNRIDAGWSGGLGAAMSTALPIYPIRYSDTVQGDNGYVFYPGDYFLDADVWNNPTMVRDLKQWRTNEWRFLNNARIVYTPNKDLNIVATGSYERREIKDDIYEPALLIYPDTTHGAGIAKRYPTTINNYNGNAFAEYTFHLQEDKANLKWMVGTEYQYSNTNSSSIEYGDMTGPMYNTDLVRTDSLVDIENPETEWAFVSAFSRLNYSLKDRYYVQANFRVDGSSKFGPDKRYGFFPSASVGWVMSEENFMKKYDKVISYWKWRASWGINGNAGLPDYQWFGQWSPPQNNGITYNNQPILFQQNLPNPGLSWEQTESYDFGVQMGWLNDRITTEFSYYNKYASDVLMQLSIPKSTGYSVYWDNVGEIINRGVEFTVKSRNLVGKFQWTTDLNIAHNYNEITSIGGYSEDAVSGGTNDTRVVVGSPVGTNFLVKFSHVDQETGRPVYLNKDGEATYNWSPDDRVPVGSVLPTMIGGMTNTFRYQNWDLVLVLVASIGSDIYDSSSKRQLGVVTDWNMRDEIYDRWRKPGDVTEFPRLTRDAATYGAADPWINTDQWLHEADYLRFRRLALGYNFQNVKAGKATFSRFRIEGSITNFLTITNFNGLDPEIARDFENNADRNMSVNVTYLTPPQEKTYNLALYLTF